VLSIGRSKAPKENDPERTQGKIVFVRGLEFCLKSTSSASYEIPILVASSETGLQAVIVTEVVTGPRSAQKWV
ncbi:MAG: hypothetical protein ACHQ1H_07345, partial [Nitrososphaerales archaeon]